MAANPEPLPPTVLALPQSVRDAMGDAWGQVVIETLNRLAMAPAEEREEVSHGGPALKAASVLTEPKTKSGRRASSLPAVTADVR